MKLFYKGKDGGPESTVTGYWLIEWKGVLSIALLHFSGRSREALHTHAFNAVSWLLKGCLVEEVHFEDGKGYVNHYRPRLKPILTKRECLHMVHSVGSSWAITFRGPWQPKWREVIPSTGESYSLTNGRVKC